MITQTAVRERPILFSQEMVRALLAGTKSCTRRLVKPQPHAPTVEYGDIEESEKYPGEFFQWKGGEPLPSFSCPYVAGQTLWVRETFDIVNDPAAYHAGDGPREDNGYECPDAIKRGPNGERWVVDYRADSPSRIMDKHGGRKWRPSIFMPRWASRLTLEIVSVRVDKIRSITYDDAIREGCSSLEEFQDLWCKLNGEQSWESNTWVWIVDFRKV